MSIIRRAHPDISNEVAFVALAQSRGRASEATAVLHLPRAKDEAALVTMMLDVAAFISLTRETTERRRQSRQLEKHRRMVAVQQRQEARYLRNQGHRRDNNQEQQLLLDQDIRQGQQQHGDEPRQCQPEGGEQHGRSLGGLHGGYECGGNATTTLGHASGKTRRRQHQYQHQHQHQHLHQHQHQILARIDPADGNDGSRGESRRSGSAPSLLPPIEGRLTEGTPPSPDSLKAVLSTSTSVAVEVPNGFGFTSQAERAKKEQAFVRGHGSTKTGRYIVILTLRLYSACCVYAQEEGIDTD